MSVPPLSIWMRVEAPGHRPIRVWLPLFLLWLVLLPLMLLVLAVTVVADVVLFFVGERYHHYTLLLVRCLDLLGQTRGTKVQVNGDRSIVELTIL